MLDRLFGFTVHPFLQLLGMIILSFGLPFNKVLMSIGTIWLASNIILKADFKSYWKNWRSNILAWFVLGILILHLIGLTYTNDFDYAFRDLNTKLPLFVIPLSIIAFPIRKEWLNYVLYFFLLSLCITTMINLYTYWSNPQADFRSLSLFGSHIRYTILVVMGILVCIYFLIQKKKFGMLWLAPLLWFAFYVYQSQVFAGYVSIIMIILAAILFGILNLNNKAVKIGLLILTIFGLFGCIFMSVKFLEIDKQQIDFTELPEKTPRGNEYIHDTTFVWYENGNHVMSYISTDELEQEWNKRSDIDYSGTDQNGHKIQSTLVRYMASKGLKKDKDGMQNMTREDIENVEKGYTNYKQVSGSPLTRIENLKNDIFMYSLTGDPNGNSFIERIEHFSVGMLIVRDHPFLGVGTGDVQNIFNDYYKKTNTKLDRNKWNRAHNQSLTFWITFGVFGFILFSGLWVFVGYQSVKLNSFFVLCFCLIAIGSFLSEDTIETQQGVTFIAFFLAVSHILLQYKRHNLK